MTELEKLFTMPSPAELGPGPRAGVLSENAIRKVVDGLNVPTNRAETFLALALLWHDHHDVAHGIAQDVADADGSYVHAILHRREPDYGNAKYWFRRVGTHPIYHALGQRAAETLRSSGSKTLADTIAPAGKWDAMAMVDACERAARRPDGDDIKVLQQIQHSEFRLLAEYLAGGK